MNLADLKIDRGAANRAKKTRRGNPWPMRAALLAGAGVLAWLFWQPVADAIDRLRLPAVRVTRVVESHPASIGAVAGAAANGYVVAARRAALSADTPGRIVEMLVAEGSIVEKGEVVARLYADEYAAAVARADAEVAAAAATVSSTTARLEAARAESESSQKSFEAAQAIVADAQAALTFAASQLERERGLLAGGISSQADVDQAVEQRDRALAQLRRAEAESLAAEARTTDARFRVTVAEADVGVAEARVEVARAAAAQARATLDKTVVRAPFGGIVVLKDAEVGEVVSPNSQGGSNARGSVVTLVDPESLEVQADVPETSLGEVRLGAPVDVFLDAYPERRYEGRVDRIWPTADRQKATVEVRVAFARRDELLRPDLGVRVVFRADDAPADPEATAEASILVPEECIVLVDGRPGAFVVERDIVRFVPVELGARRGGRVAVPKGLDPGQTIVVAPPTRLATGDRVRIESS